MKINEVMKITGLTKKAIYYYENEGLITPMKNKENDYRIYTEDNVEILKKITVLRKLDVSVKDIGIIINDSLKLNEVMVKQLQTIEERIKYLNKSKNIIKSLIEDYNNGNTIIRTDNLDKLNVYLDMDAKTCSGYMKRELKRIFPCNYGKAMSIFYGAYLDEPIDTEEKEHAWHNLVNILDSIEEIKFPTEIKNILDKIYESEEQMANVGKILNSISEGKVLNKLNKMSIEERQSLIKKMKDSMLNDNQSYAREDFIKIDKILNENCKVMLQEFAKHLKILSNKYRQFCENILNVQKTIGEIDL